MCLLMVYRPDELGYTKAQIWPISAADYVDVIT